MWRLASATARHLARATSLQPAWAPSATAARPAAAVSAAASPTTLRRGFPLATRPFTASSPVPRSTPAPSTPESTAARKEARRAAANALAAAGGRGGDITDQIPVRPVGVVEGASYTVVIVAGVACAAAVLYAAASELLLQPKEYAAFAAALDRAREDPRVAVRLGTPITGYGQEARGRAARQRVPHRLRVDGEGVEHITVQFWARGPAGVARITAEMHKGGHAARGGGGRPGGGGGGDAFPSAPSSSASPSDWSYDYMVADVDAPAPARIVIVAPQAAAAVGAAPAPAGRLSFGDEPARG